MARAAMLSAEFGLPDLSWSKDGDALLRKYNRQFLDGEPIPTTVPLDGEMGEAHQAMVKNRNRTTSGSERAVRDKHEHNKAKEAQRKA